MQDLAEACGFRVIAAVAAIAKHSIIHEFAAGRPDVEDRKELEAFGQEILKASQSGNAGQVQVPGDRPYKKVSSLPIAPKGSKDCTECGICAENCPAEAIDPATPKKTDGSRCIACMRCVVKCPNHARKVNGAMLSMAGMALKKACSGHKENELFL